MLCYAMLRYAVLCCAVPCHATPRHATPCHEARARLRRRLEPSRRAALLGQLRARGWAEVPSLCGAAVAAAAREEAGHLVESMPRSLTSFANRAGPLWRAMEAMAQHSTA